MQLLQVCIIQLPVLRPGVLSSHSSPGARIPGDAATAPGVRIRQMCSHVEGPLVDMDGLGSGAGK